MRVVVYLGISLISGVGSFVLLFPQGVFWAMLWSPFIASGCSLWVALVSWIIDDVDELDIERPVSPLRGKASGTHSWAAQRSRRGL